MYEIDDNRQVYVLGSGHYKDVIKSAISSAVNVFNKAIVDYVAFEIGRCYGVHVGPDVENVRFLALYVFHGGSEGSTKLAVCQEPCIHVHA